MLARGVRTGLVIGGGLWVLWALAVMITDKEPQEMREAVRIKQLEPRPGDGMSFDLRYCSHCPVFFLFDRGFGTGGIFAPLVLASLPAALVSGDDSRFWIPELRPVLFGSMLLMEGLLLGVGMEALRARTPKPSSK